MVRPLTFTLLTIVLIAVIPRHDFAQTNKDEEEAEKIARLFSRRLRQTRDVAPLIHVFFADDFLERYLHSSKDDHFLLFIKRDLALKSSRAELRRYYVALLNWLYLSDLYIFSKYSSKSDEVSELTLEKMYPAEVWRVIIADPIIGAFMKSNLSNPGVMISSRKQLRSLTSTYEKAVRLMRHRTKSGVRPTKQYRETLVDWGERFKFFKPWPSTCDDDCYGLPPNSKLIFVNVPSFQINLARINQRMKILLVMPYVD